EEVGLLGEGEDPHHPARPVGLELRRERLGEVRRADREGAVRGFVIVDSQADLLQVVRALGRRAASRALCTAGSSSAISTPMMAMTTSNSIRVNAASDRRRRPGLAWRVDMNGTLRDKAIGTIEANARRPGLPADSGRGPSVRSVNPSTR